MKPKPKRLTMAQVQALLAKDPSAMMATQRPRFHIPSPSRN